MLLERGRLETPNKNSRSKARNQQRTQPTNSTGWIWDSNPGQPVGEACANEPVFSKIYLG